MDDLVDVDVSASKTFETLFTKLRIALGGYLFIFLFPKINHDSLSYFDGTT